MIVFFVRINLLEAWLTSPKGIPSDYFLLDYYYPG